MSVLSACNHTLSPWKTPLDEGPDESYHRKTNLENRASNSRLPWIKASARHVQVHRRSRDLMRSFGKKGRAVSNCEHRLLKRVLHVGKKKWWRRVKMSNKAFYEQSTPL